MSSLNKVLILGRLGQDPELRYGQSGAAYCNMSIATDEGYTDAQGQRVQQTEWHKVVCFGKTAENAAKYLAKGRLALIEGKLKTDKWQDQSGVDRYTTKIKAAKVTFLPSGNGASQPSAPRQEATPPGDPFSEDLGPAFPSEAGAIDETPF